MFSMYVRNSTSVSQCALERFKIGSTENAIRFKYLNQSVYVSQQRAPKLFLGCEETLKRFIPFIPILFPEPYFLTHYGEKRKNG